MWCSNMNKDHVNCSVVGLGEYSDSALAQEKLFSEYPKSLIWFAIACYVLFMLLGIPGNLITIVALVKYKKVKNATSIFIMNLSTCDLLSCSIILPLNALFYGGPAWAYGKTLCRVYALLKYTLSAVSIFTIVAITFNRYILISHTRYYFKIYGKRNPLLMIITIWLCAIGMFMPVFFEQWGRFGSDHTIGFCTIIPDCNNISPKIFLNILAFIGPCIVIFLCYARILWIVKNTRNITHNSRIHDETDTKSSNDLPDAAHVPPIDKMNQETNVPTEIKSSQNEDNKVNDSEVDKTKINETVEKIRKKLRSTSKFIKGTTKKDKKLRKMIAAIIFFYCLCHLPVMLVKTTNLTTMSHPFANIGGSIFIHLATCINPIIYVMMSSEYRIAYKNLFNRFLR